jgi:hypothetical protein
VCESAVLKPLNEDWTLPDASDSNNPARTQENEGWELVAPRLCCVSSSRERKNGDIDAAGGVDAVTPIHSSHGPAPVSRQRGGDEVNDAAMGLRSTCALTAAAAPPPPDSVSPPLSDISGGVDSNTVAPNAV